LRKPRLPLFGRLVEASPTSGRRGPAAAELFALVHGGRAQAPAAAAFSALVVGDLQRVDVQVGIVAPAGRFEHGVVRVVDGQVALRMERLRLAADVRVRAVDAAHLVPRAPLAAAGRRPFRLRLERFHLHAERRPQVASRIRRQVFRVQVLLHLLATHERKRREKYRFKYGTRHVLRV